ncbi:spore coat U domain-containing protein [Pseudochrobactrum sp. MP213Fo]|uniref:Csu type fimbrial protein n=1 Tax=Pseudochrobactrum sp. MP213Fo TaxID=3022250 RepID=UPI003B9F2AD8
MYAKKTILSVTCLMMSAGLISTSHAATDVTGSLKAKLTIGAACTLTSGNGSVLDFGSVTDLSSDVNAETPAGSGIKVKCSDGIAYEIGLNLGLHGHELPPPYEMQRAMALTPIVDILYYSLYRDAEHQEPWYDLDSKSTFNGTGDGTEQEIPIYGVIPKTDTPSSGNYSDTVKVTLRF